MRTASTLLATALNRYSQAILDDRRSDAVFEASHIYHHGELVIIHPAFIRALAKHSPDITPEEMLRVVSKFLTCVADGLKDGHPANIDIMQTMMHPEPQHDGA